MLRKLIIVLFIFMLFVIVHCDHTSAAGPSVSSVPYMGGNGSHWDYALDDGSEATLEVVEKYKEIHDRRYKVINESVPLWSKLIEGVFDSNTLFVGKNPFLTTEERGSHIAGYGWEASVFLEKEMTQQFQQMGQVFQPNQLPATQWVILKKIEVGNSWVVVNLNYKLTFEDGAKRRVSAKIFADVVSVENITTELGEFEVFIIEYTYREEERIVTLCSIYLADIGPARIVIGDITADLIDYEILPHSPPDNANDITSDNNSLSTTWAKIKTQ